MNGTLANIESFDYSSITPDVIAEAAAAGITGVKVYPQGKFVHEFSIFSIGRDK